MIRTFTRTVISLFLCSFELAYAKQKLNTNTLSLRAQMLYAESSKFDETQIYQNFGFGSMGIYHSPTEF